MGWRAGRRSAVAPWMAMTRTSSPGPTGVLPCGQAGGPGLAGELDPAVGVGDGLEDAGVAADERGRADVVVDLPSVNWRLIIGRTTTRSRSSATDDGDDDLQRERRPEGRGDGARGGATGEHEEDEVDGGDLDRRRARGRAPARRATSCRSASPSAGPLSVVRGHLFDARARLGVPVSRQRARAA